MTTQQALPNAIETTRFVASLLDCEPLIKETNIEAAFQAAAFANYVNAEGETDHFIALDIAAAAIMGASLTRFPVSLVSEAKGSGQLPENILANLEEILNIAVNLFPASNGSRLILQGVGTNDEATRAYERANSNTTSFEVDIPNYGTGTVVFG